MRIEIWSDVVCPWCYIGKRRLERALESFAHRDEVEVVWRSYLLDPAAPREPRESSLEMIARKYGRSVSEARAMQDQVEAVAAEEGLVYRLSETVHASTVDAHRLLHLAAEVGGEALRAALKEDLLAAYFLQARNPADHAVLTEVATAAGLPADRVARVLAGEEYADAVWADVEQAQRYGATGVPFFVLDGAFGVSGAQPVAVFEQALARAWETAHPSVTMVGGAADACGPDGCPV